MRLPDGSKIELHSIPYESGGISNRTLPPLLVRWQNKRVLYIMADRKTAILTMEAKSSIATVSALAGVALAESRDCSIILLLVLAFLSLRGELPTEEQLSLIQVIATQGLPQSPRSESAPLTAVREGVKDQFTDRREEILFPNGPWNLARTLLVFGEGAWSLHGEEAWHWGSVPVSKSYSQDAPVQNRIVLSLVAGLMFSSTIERRLPIPLVVVPQKKESKTNEKTHEWNTTHTTLYTAHCKQ